MKVDNNKCEEGLYFGGGDQNQSNMMMDISSMYSNMQPHCNSANGYHHTATAAASDIMYAANTASYFPGHHHHHHQHHQHPAAVPGNPSIRQNPSTASAAHQRSATNQHAVDVFPVNRAAQQSQAASPGIASTSTSSSAPSSSNPVNAGRVTALPNQNHYSPNLYSPSAIEYGITTTGSPNGASVEYEAFYQSPAEAGGGSAAAAGHPDPNIISTDGGLSYTNLDYMYGNQGQHPNANEMPGYSLSEDCSPSTPNSTNTPPSAATWLTSGGGGSGGGVGGPGHMLIHNHLQTGAHHPSPPLPTSQQQQQHQNHHHHAHMLHPGSHLHHQQQQQQHGGRQYHPLDGVHVTPHHQSMQNSSNLAAPGSGSPIAGSGAMQMGPHSPQQQQHGLHSPANHPQSSSNQSSVQQFKWMQIKRNVPKPSGESSQVSSRDWDGVTCT